MFFHYTKWRVMTILVILGFCAAALVWWLTGSMWWASLVFGSSETSIVMRFLLKLRREARRKAHQAALMQECRERDEEHRRKCAEENTRRAPLRAQWLTENPLKLYVNTMCGVTAVLTPADYDRVTEETRRARRNELWQHENLLRPVRSTCMFVTKSGRDHISRIRGNEQVSNHLPWITQLDDLVEGWGVTLEVRQDIFVPYVGTNLLTNDEQWKAINGYPDSNFEESLIWSQVPRELHSVR